jgi:hypothetical protein
LKSEANDPAHNGRGDFELINGKKVKTSNPGNRSSVRVPVNALVRLLQLYFNSFKYL